MAACRRALLDNPDQQVSSLLRRARSGVCGFLLSSWSPSYSWPLHQEARPGTGKHLHLSTVLCLSSGTLANLIALPIGQSPCLKLSHLRLSSDYCGFRKVAEPFSRRLYGYSPPSKHCSISSIILTPECQELATRAGQYTLHASLWFMQPPDPVLQRSCCPNRQTRPVRSMRRPRCIRQGYREA